MHYVCSGAVFWTTAFPGHLNLNSPVYIETHQKRECWGPDRWHSLESAEVVTGEDSLKYIIALESVRSTDDVTNLY